VCVCVAAVLCLSKLLARYKNTWGIYA
jgi:hypothetical protein